MSWFSRLLLWRENHIKERNFVLILALVTGILCGFASLIFKWLIHFISGSLLLNIDITTGNYWYLTDPLPQVLRKFFILFPKIRAGLSPTTAIHL